MLFVENNITLIFVCQIFLFFIFRLPVADNGAKYDLINPTNIPFGERNEDLPLVIRSWPTQCDPTMTSEQKFIIPATFSQQFACNIQTLPIDEKFFLQ